MRTVIEETESFFLSYFLSLIESAWNYWLWLLLGTSIELDAS